MILSDSDTLGPEDFDLAPAGVGKDGPGSLNLEDNERRLVKTALERHGGNVSRAAVALGITRAALYRRMEKFGL